MPSEQSNIELVSTPTTDPALVERLRAGKWPSEFGPTARWRDGWVVLYRGSQGATIRPEEARKLAVELMACAEAAQGYRS